MSTECHVAFVLAVDQLLKRFVTVVDLLDHLNGLVELVHLHALGHVLSALMFLELLLDLATQARDKIGDEGCAVADDSGVVIDNRLD